MNHTKNTSGNLGRKIISGPYKFGNRNKQFTVRH